MFLIRDVFNDNFSNNSYFLLFSVLAMKREMTSKASSPDMDIPLLPSTTTYTMNQIIDLYS